MKKNDIQFLGGFYRSFMISCRSHRANKKMSVIYTIRNCGDMGSGMCHGDGEKILYVWGKNAPKLKLPPGKSVPCKCTAKQIFYM